jgi:hypothetical protein
VIPSASTDPPEAMTSASEAGRLMAAAFAGVETHAMTSKTQRDEIQRATVQILSSFVLDRLFARIWESSVSNPASCSEYFFEGRQGAG